MPKTKKEGIIFGVCFCGIMVYFMGLLNISIHMNGLSFESFKTSLISFPITFTVAFVLENLLVGKINKTLIDHFVSDSDSMNSYILFNCFFIVTMMSILMTLIGGVLSGENILTVVKEFFIRWPKNFCAAFFLNILVAGPISRLVLSKVQKHSMKQHIFLASENNDFKFSK